MCVCVWLIFQGTSPIIRSSLCKIRLVAGNWLYNFWPYAGGPTFPCTSPAPRQRSASGWSVCLLCKHHLCVRDVQSEGEAYNEVWNTTDEHHLSPLVLQHKIMSLWRTHAWNQRTCCDQNAALGVHDSLTQRLWGESCKLNREEK